MPDVESFRLALAGDRSASESLVRTYHGLLVAMVRPLVGESLADDVAQETWIKALTAVEKFEGRSTLRTWLVSIALNEARMLLRKSGREVLVEHWGNIDSTPFEGRFLEDGHWQEGPRLWDHNTPDAILTEAELQGCIDKHIGMLPPDQQAALRLREMEEMDFADISAALSLSEGNVRVMLHRARQKLYVMVEHFEETGTC